jgi:predicted metal-dependent HD superfamily phosphohydrolase
MVDHLRIVMHFYNTMLAKIEKLYEQDHRWYHGMDHVCEMFDFLKEENVYVTPEMEAAVLFHDAVYVPGFDRNEEASVELMKTMLWERLTC